MEWLQVLAIEGDDGSLNYLLEADVLNHVCHEVFGKCMVVILDEINADSLLGDNTDENYEFET